MIMGGIPAESHPKLFLPDVELHYKAQKGLCDHNNKKNHIILHNDNT